MSPKALQEWLLTHSANDEWWVAYGNETIGEPLNLEQIKAFQLANPDLELRLLHTSHVEMDSPPWVDYEPDLKPTKKEHLTRPPWAREKKKIAPKEKKHSKVKKVVALSSSHAEKVVEGQTNAVEQKSKLPIAHFAILGALLVILGVALMMFLGGGAEEEAAAYADRNTTLEDAYQAAQPRVKQLLKMTGVWKFPSSDNKNVAIESLGKYRYAINGFVTVTKADQIKRPRYEIIMQEVLVDKEFVWKVIYWKSGKTVKGKIPKGVHMPAL